MQTEEPTELDPPPLIQISLAYYLTLACRGIEEVAIVSKEFGGVVLEADPLENISHVEYFQDNDKLAKIYPIKVWRESCARDKRLKEISEQTRQVRFKLEQEQAERKEKIQRKRDILQEVIADIRKLHGPDVDVRLAANQKGLSDVKRYDFFVSLVFKALIGEHPKAAEKFQISHETIKEFSSLPKDPEFKNFFITGEVSQKESEL